MWVFTMQVATPKLGIYVPIVVQRGLINGISGWTDLISCISGAELHHKLLCLGSETSDS